MRKVVFYIAVCLFAVRAYGQTEVIDEILENYIGQNTEDVNYEEISGTLDLRMKHPLNINTATADDLQELYLLNHFQINSLLEHIDKYGQLISIYELQTVYGFNKELVQLLQPFIYTGSLNTIPCALMKDGFRNSSHEIVNTFRFNQEKEWKHNIIYNGNYEEKIKYGVRLENDAGENNGSEWFYKYDYFSGHVSVKNVGCFKKIIAGDYDIRMGQGLVVWTSPSFFNTSNPADAGKSGRIIKEHTSFEENRFFRGVAAETMHGKFGTAVFLSNKKADANIVAYDEALNKAVAISSFQTGGLHNASSLLADKHAAGRTAMGADIHYKGQKLNVGSTYLFEKISAEMIKKDEQYSKYSFSGDKSFNTSIYYRYIRKKVAVFGEEAWSHNGGIAVLNSITLNHINIASVSLLHRHYTKKYYSPYSSGFSAYNSIAGEDGLYLGAAFKILQHAKLSAYYDAFANKWLKYNINSPSKGDTYFLRFEHVADECSITVHLSNKNGMKKKPSENVPGITADKKYSSTHFRIHISNKVSEIFEIRSRAEFSFYSEEKYEQGCLFYNDIILAPEIFKHKTKIISRIMFFDADSYNSRIYAYENDMKYSFCLPAFFNKGYSAYMMFSCHLSRQIQISAKISVSKTYRMKNEIEAGGQIEIEL